MSILLIFFLMIVGPTIYKLSDLWAASDEETPLLRTQARYSTFSNRQKKYIILAAALASTFSPISANIYYPALNSIALDLHISASLINLTITTYMVGLLALYQNPGAMKKMNPGK